MRIPKHGSGRPGIKSAGGHCMAMDWRCCGYQANIG